MKRPAFQFYPADWRKDVALQSCSMAAQGFWINALCLMHECEPYGHLAINGRPMTEAQIGRAFGMTSRELTSALEELRDAGVLSVGEDGIYSRRMVRDEQIRNARAAGGQLGAEHGVKGKEGGSKGGRPRLNKGGLETPLPLDLKPPPSSSSSSSSAKALPQPDGFGEFWQAYPRKVGKAEAEKAWRKLGHVNGLLATILQAVERQRQPGCPLGGELRYVPHPATWINGKRWTDEVDASAGGLKPWEH